MDRKIINKSLMHHIKSSVAGILIGLVIIMLAAYAPPAVNASSVEIYIDIDALDFGDIRPSQSSAKKCVFIENTSSQEVDITLEVIGDDTPSHTFYQQSLYVNDIAYNSDQIICTIPSDNTVGIVTQLRVPSDWLTPGIKEATFTFWAEAG